MESRKVFVVFNPRAGEGRFGRDPDHIERDLLSRARSKGRKLDISIGKPASGIEAEAMAKETATEGSDVVAAAGGDGTVLAVANGLFGTDAFLGILPIGSGNDTIQSLSSHRDMGRCMDDIISGAPRRIDLGAFQGRHFLNVLGIGLDAEINHAVAMKRDLVKSIGPFWTYMYAVLKVLPGFRAYDVRISFDGGPWMDRSIGLCTIGNGTTCGGGFKLTPKAVMDDGRLDVSLSPHLGLVRSIANLPRTVKGTHVHMKECEYRHVERISIESKGKELPYHVDGEPGFARKLNIEVAKKALLTVH